MRDLNILCSEYDGRTVDLETYVGFIGEEYRIEYQEHDCNKGGGGGNLLMQIGILMWYESKGESSKNNLNEGDQG